MTDKEYDLTGWVMFKQPGCKFCEIALDTLDRLGATVRIMDVSTDRALKDFMSASGLKTVPQIFHHGYLIGGSTELREYARVLEDDGA